MGNAHYYLGIYYIKKGRTKNGEFHLKRALSYLSDPEKIRKTEEILNRVHKDFEKSPKKEQTDFLNSGQNGKIAW